MEPVPNGRAGGDGGNRPTQPPTYVEQALKGMNIAWQ